MNNFPLAVREIFSKIKKIEESAYAGFERIFGRHSSKTDQYSVGETKVLKI